MEESIIKNKHSSQIILSIIVPIYNVEKYIAKCAISLSSQTCPPDKFEVIFVNDGTKDNSISILKGTINFIEHKNFYIIEKENGGLSSARNYGIQHAHGEYIWFIDSDDWIENNSIEVLIKNMTANPDIILMTQYYHNTDNKQTFAYKHSSNKISNGTDLFKESPPVCSVCYICKRTYLIENSFKFLEGIYHEDAELIPKLLYKATKVQTISVPLYHHYKREESITQTASPKRVYDLMTVIKNNITFYQNHIKRQDKKWFAKILSAHIYAVLELSHRMNENIKSDVNFFFYENPILLNILSYKNLQSCIFAQLLKIFPTKTITIFNLLWKIKGR